VAGLYKRRFANATGMSGPGPAEEAVLGDWLISLINTMRADMDNDKLYPPGCVYIMVCKMSQRKLIEQEYHKVHGIKPLPLKSPEDTSVKDKVYKAVLRRCESVELRFRERKFNLQDTTDDSIIHEKHVTRPPSFWIRTSYSAPL
jgi:hypothetical protein